ncbi:MAG: glycosyltransferase [Lachnospiraceae bacterium]|nr:glycosyltransferase [Lachnospiraceae bacterium]
MMKSIETKIAETEAQWRRYRQENAGIRESAKLLSGAVKRGAAKRIRVAERCLHFSCKNETFAPAYDRDRQNIVVSLTSTRARLQTIFPTLQSLIAQSRKPDLIILWLGESDKYPKAVTDQIKQMGISVKYREDLGPNTKYYYAFREYRGDLVITVDDDILYHKNMIQELYDAHQKHPDLVIARRINRMRFGRNRRPVRYRSWIWEYKDARRPAHDLLATGVGGVLYPPNVCGLPCFESRDFRRVAPGCDDIWLKFCELSQDVKVCAVAHSGFYLDVINPRSQKTNLAKENVDRGKNDRSIKACAEYFGMKEDLCERVLGN